MRFQVTRSSIWDDEISPCQNAEPVQRMCHGLYTNTDWFIEIETLEELLDFANAEGSRVIVHRNGENQYLEIYDGMRE